MGNVEEGRILEVRDSKTGCLLGLCQGVREDGVALHVTRMILLGSTFTGLEAVPTSGAIEAGHFPFDLRDGHKLCYEGCAWDLWDATYANGAALVVCDGVVHYVKKGKGAQ